MKTFQELVNDSRNMKTELDALHKFLTEEARTRYIAITGVPDYLLPRDLTEDQKRKLQELHAEEKEKSDRYNLLKVALRVLFDNIRIAYFQETMPKVLEVLKKYHNKPYGPVLKQKISDELKALGVYMYISTEPEYRSDEIHLRPVSNYYMFGNDDMTIVTRFQGTGDDRQKLPIIGGTTGNRLQVYSFDNYMLQNCGNYAEDPEKVAAELMARYDRIKEQFDRLESDLRALNDNLPSHINWIDAGKLHYAGLASHLA